MAFSCAETIYVHAEPMKDPTRNGRESVSGERPYVSPTYKKRKLRLAITSCKQAISLRPRVIYCDNWWHRVAHCVLYTIPFAMAFGIDWRIAALLTTHMVIDTLKAREHAIGYAHDRIAHLLIVAALYFQIFDQYDWSE